MNNLGIGSWIHRRAMLSPWKTVLINENTRLTYFDLHLKINRLAHGLRSLGVVKGDRIAYLNHNHITYFETFFACGLLGAVFVPLNIRLHPEHLIYILHKSGCKVLIYGPTAKNSIKILESKTPDINVIGIIDDQNGKLTYSSLTSAQSDSSIDESVSPDETALLLFTSGTTGKPKGVRLSHNNLSWNVFNLMSCTDFLSDDRILINAPLNRMGALGVAALPGIFKGAALVITSESQISKIVRVIENQKISVLFNGPDFYRELDEYATKRNIDFSHIRFCIVGGDSVPPALVQRWLDRGIQLQQGYGLTEAAPAALMLDKDEMICKNGSAGRPMFFTNIRVVSPDMKDVESNQLGEIILKGPNITRGYWQSPVLNKEKFTEDGWLRTGDIARLDNDNHFYVMGRLTDGIDLKNRIVYPSEIENIIVNQPGIVECAAIGTSGNKPDRLVVFVVLENGTVYSERELMRLWSEKLPPELIPDSIIIAKSLPKNANGKIIRQQLRESISQKTYSHIE